MTIKAKGGRPPVADDVRMQAWNGLRANKRQIRIMQQAAQRAGYPTVQAWAMATLLTAADAVLPWRRSCRPSMARPRRPIR